MLCGGEGTSYNIFDRFDSRLLLRNRYFIRSSRGNSRTSLRSSAQKSFTIAGCENLGFVTREKSDGQLWSFGCRTFSGFHDPSSIGQREVWSQCQNNDSLQYVNGTGKNAELLENNEELVSDRSAQTNGSGEEHSDKTEEPTLDELRESLQKAIRDLEVARLNSTMFEEKAQRISEAAIALQDEATSARNDVISALNAVLEIVNEESLAKEAVQKATMALSLAEARLQVVEESLEAANSGTESPDNSEASGPETDVEEDEKALLLAQEEIRECQVNLEKDEADLRRVQGKKEELQKEVDRLNEVAENLLLNASKADEEVANIMQLAEQAVAFELEATQHVNDAEIALQKTEKSISKSEAVNAESSQGQVFSDDVSEDERVVLGIPEDGAVEWDRDVMIDGDSSVFKPLPDALSEIVSDSSVDLDKSEYLSDRETGNSGLDSLQEAETEAEKSKTSSQPKMQETQKDLTRDSNSPLPKSLIKKSSRFFSASFFSSTDDGVEFTPGSVFHGTMEMLRSQGPKLVFGLVLFGAGYVSSFLPFLTNNFLI